MTVDDAVQAHFADRLRTLGFHPLAGLPTTWTKITDPGSDLLISFETNGAEALLHVFLRRRSQGTQEVLALADAVGMAGYSYASDVYEVLAAVRADFDRYGEPWLRGESVSSPALEASKAAFSVAIASRLRSELQHAFKSGDHPRVLQLADQLATHGPLDVLSERYRVLAATRDG